MTSSAPAQADLSSLGLDLHPSVLPEISEPSTTNAGTSSGHSHSNGNSSGNHHTTTSTSADSVAATVAVSLPTSTANTDDNTFAIYNNLTVEQGVAALTSSTDRDVFFEAGTSADPFQQPILNPDNNPLLSPLPLPPLPATGSHSYLPDFDLLPPPPLGDPDAIMTDAPAQTADAAERAPSEPVTPIQTPAQDRVLGTRRRSSTNETNTAIPFASASEASRIRNAITNNFNMMSLAQMSSPHPMGMTHIPQTPTVVTPAQVTLPKNIAEGGNPFEENMYPFPTVEEGLESFARVEFADSVFQMTTYAVIIGRDQRAMDQAKRDERRAGEYRRIAEEHANMGLPPPSPEMHDRNRKFSKSYVSEEGGMLGPESDGESTTRPQKRRKQTRSGSPQDEVEQEDAPLIMDRQYVSHTPGAAAVDLKSLRPSPHHTPFIGIHSPGPDIASKTKAISREHLKIQFNPKKNVFEAIPLHKNGFFCDDVHYRQESVVLRSGSRLQIKDVDFTFIVNGVGRGRTGAEDLEDGPKLARRYAEGGKEMSVEFELGQNKGDMVSDSDELSDLEESPAELSEDAEGELKSESEAEDADGDAVMREQMPEQPAKRRGPGRPPKDGIMSKRERRELAKLEQELERQRQLETHVPAAEPVPYSSPTGELGDVPMKRKVGRPRKHPLPEGEDGKPEKRKYKPRKPKEEEGSEAERRRERKERRLARPKSPPLKLRREDFTEEQLSKPNKNYGILIDEVLREAGADGLILKQIYNRISAKYPFYHFCTETKGWESSVRHNLIGNSAFSKDPKSGAWTRVLGIELDAGKKRKGDAAAAERASAAASAAAAANGGQPYGVGAYGNATYPGYGAGGHKVPPGAVQGYSQPGGSIQGYQHGQQQGNAMGMGQTYPGQPGQAVHQLSQSPHLGTPPTGVTPRPAGVAPSAQQHTNGNAQAPTTGAAVNYPRHASGTPQLNGTTATPGANVHNPYYGTHSQTPNQAQPANGVAFPSRQTLAPRPAVLHPKLLAQLKKFVKGLHSHAGLDRRWVFSAFNRVLGLKTQANEPRPDTLLHTNKGSPLAEVMNKRLVSALEGIVSRYINEHVKAKAKEPASSSAIEGNEILHPDLVALFFELKETFQRGRTAAADGDNKEDKDKEREREKDKEMGEYMVLSCFDRVVGARDESIFEGLKEEGVMEEKEAARWVAAEAELVRVVKACVLKLGFTLSS